MEAVVEAIHPMASAEESQRGKIACIEVRIQKVYVHPEIRMAGTTDRIDPDRWHPLITSFQQFYGLGEKVHSSRLARIPERLYRTPEVDAAGRP